MPPGARDGRFQDLMLDANVDNTGLNGAVLAGGRGARLRLLFFSALIFPPPQR